MNDSGVGRKPALGLFPDRPTPRLYDRVVVGQALLPATLREARPATGFAASFSFTAAPFRATWPKGTSTVS